MAEYIAKGDNRFHSLALLIILHTVREGTPLYIPPLTYSVNKKIIKNPNEFSG